MTQALFQVWIFSFLLYRVNIVGSLSVDNLMVPFLVLLWLFTGARANGQVNRARFRMVLLATLVFLSLIVADIAKLGGGGSAGALLPPIMEHLKHYAYVLLPLLYISSEQSLKWTLTSLLAVAVINSALAMIGALGLASPFVLVGESTRIPGLMRARGPLVNDGDMALLISLLAVLVWTVARHRLDFAGPKWVRLLGIVAMLSGIIAIQSRNLILTVAMAFGLYYWLRMVMQGGRGGARVLLSVVGIFLFFGAVTFVAVYADEIIAWVTHMFGVSGEGTVRDRLSSYSSAMMLLEGKVLFGLTATQIAANSLFVAKLHNMWLGLALFSGIFGVVAVFALIAASFVGALRLSRSPDWKEYGVVLASFILASLWFSPNFYPGHNAFIFWFCIGLAMTSGQTLYFSRLHSLQVRPAGDVSEPSSQVPGRARILRYKATRAS